MIKGLFSQFSHRSNETLSLELAALTHIFLFIGEHTSFMISSDASQQEGPSISVWTWGIYVWCLHVLLVFTWAILGTVVSYYSWKNMAQVQDTISKEICALNIICLVKIKIVFYLMYIEQQNKSCSRL